MILIAVMLGASAATPPPPPMVVSTPATSPTIVIAPPPPMPPPIVRMASPLQPAPPPVLLDVAVSASGRELYRGALRVARGAGASYSQSWSQASAVPCTGMRSYDSGERHSLSVQLYWTELPDSGPAVSVSVNWQRPTPGTSCTKQGSRTVQLSQVVPLAGGRSQMIEGDAGLRVTITPR
jgi:hypothetical protein